MTKVRDLVWGSVVVVANLLRRMATRLAGIGTVRLISARLLVPGLSAIERLVIAHEEAALRRARNLY
jgi:hypothetical protein